MKTISAALDAHLRQEVTTICTCWKVVRQDGQVFCFTDHDNDVVYLGQTYESESGYNRTAISGDASFGVDNADVTGFLESDRISENDLRNGLFDFANVYVFGINWMDPTQGAIALRRGWLGEVVINANGSFETELRGLHQALSFNFMESYQPECRADFCDKRCKLVLANYVRPGFAFKADSRSQFYISDGAFSAPAASVGAHRYWKVQSSVQGTNPSYIGLTEIAFFDQAGNPIAGGAISASSQYNTASPSKTRDGDINSGWLATTGDVHGWLKMDWGAGNAKDIKSIAISAFSGTDVQYMPMAFDIYYSDDGATWTLATHWPVLTAWTPSETRTFSGWGGTQAVTPMGAPAQGATTYVGGTVRFTTGSNTGKLMEVVSYDPASGLVTVFEDFPYEINVGDQLEFAQGCDKMFDTCKLYANEVNFRGEPHVPGQDAYLSYPDATT